MTTEEKAISLIQTLDDDVSLDDVIDRLYLLRKIELGIAQADAGDVMEHDAFMDEFEAEDCGRGRFVNRVGIDDLLAPASKVLAEIHPCRLQG